VWWFSAYILTFCSTTFDKKIKNQQGCLPRWYLTINLRMAPKWRFFGFIWQN
jgi:hypothetical protein